MPTISTWPRTEAGKRSYTEKAIKTFTQPEEDKLAKTQRFGLRKTMAAVGIAGAIFVPKFGLADALNTTPKEAAQNMVSDIQKHGENVKRLDGSVVLSSGQYDTLNIRPEIGTGTYANNAVKSSIPNGESVTVENPLLVTDERDGDIKLVVQVGGEKDAGYGVVAVDERTKTNIDMSGVLAVTPIEADSLEAIGSGVMVQANREQYELGAIQPIEPKR